jgi:hypothetical protein
MASFIDNALAHSLLDLMFSATAYAAPGTWYLAALKSGDVEVSAAGYTRLAVTNNATNFPAASARTKFLATVQAFIAANPGVDWGTVEAIGFYTVSTAGTRQLKVDLGGAVQNFWALAADDVFRCAAHGYIAGQRVRVAALPNVSLPTGIAAATDYYVVNPATDTFQLSLTSGGAVINFTGDGAGSVFAWRSKGISDGDILNFNANDLSLVFAS